MAGPVIRTMWRVDGFWIGLDEHGDLWRGTCGRASDMNPQSLTAHTVVQILWRPIEQVFST